MIVLAFKTNFIRFTEIGLPLSKKKFNYLELFILFAIVHKHPQTTLLKYSNLDCVVYMKYLLLYSCVGLIKERKVGTMSGYYNKIITSNVGYK